MVICGHSCENSVKLVELSLICVLTLPGLILNINAHKCPRMVMNIFFNGHSWCLMVIRVKKNLVKLFELF